MDILPTRIVRLKSLDEPVRLHATGDWHVGEAGCAETRLRESMAKIAKDRRALVLLMGDLGGFIAPDDRRWDAATVAEGLSIRDLSDWGHVLTSRIADIAKPVKNKVIGVLQGNHEDTYSSRHGVAITDHLAAAIGAPSLGYATMFTIRFQTPKEHSDLTIFATHGSGGAATTGGKLNRLTRCIQSVEANLVLMGHVHTLLSTTVSRLYQDGMRIGSRDQLGVITGTYLKTYCQGHSGYGEKAGYSPVSLGHPCITIIPRTKQMSVQWLAS